MLVAPRRLGPRPRDDRDGAALGIVAGALIAGLVVELAAFPAAHRWFHWQGGGDH